MTDLRGAPQFGSWSVPQCRIVIEYHLEVLEKIRYAGYRALLRQEVEVVGLLFGTYDGVQLRILDHRPFQLSGNSMDAWAEQLIDYNGEGLPEGQVVVGWYHLCKRRGLELPPEDVSFHERYFPEAWHVALLLRPDVNGTIHSRFFLRQPEDRNVTHSAGLAPEARAAGPDPVAAPRGVSNHSAAAAAPALARERPPAALPVPAPPANRVVTVATRPGAMRVATPVAAGRFNRFRDRKVLWMAIAAILAIAVASIFYLRTNFATPAKRPDFVRLDVANRNGKLELRWDTRLLANVRRGELEVHDGSGGEKVALDPDILAAGRFEYTPVSDVTAFRLSAQRADGTAIEGSTTYVIPAGAATSAAADTLHTPVEAAPAPADARLPADAEAVQEAASEARTATPKFFTPPPAQTGNAARARTNDPVLPPMEPIQIGPAAPGIAVPLPSASAPAPPPPVTRTAPQQRAAVAPVQPLLVNLTGRWLLLAGGYSRSPGAPESVAVNIADNDGVVRGTLEARYRAKNKNERIRFSFAGKLARGSARFPWIGSDGEHGQIEFIRVPNSPSTLEVVWYGADSKQVFDELLTRAK